MSNQKQKGSEWIEYIDEDLEIPIYICGNCGQSQLYKTNYCPDCGKKMKGTKDGD